MKKKVILGVVIIAIIAIIGCLFLFKGKYTIITLDINPSLELKVDKNENVVEVTALNDDAKVLISSDYKNKNIDEVLMNITEKIIENVDDLGKEYVILVHVDGKLSEDKVSGKLISLFEERNIPVNVIVPKVTKEDEKRAKQLGITPAKAAYLSEVVKSNSDLKMEDIKDKSVSELSEMKKTGLYCDKGYTLDGNSCIKEIETIAATKGEVCPNGFFEYEGRCYEEVPSDETDKLICHDDFKLKDNKCVRTESMNAEPSKYTCSKGEAKTRYELGLTGKNDGDANDVVCVDLSNATHPVSPCETHDGTEYTMSGGKCYWHRAPVIASGCPGKIQVGNMCWDDASNVLICEGYRDGKRYNSRSEYCEHSIKYIDPTITEYKCPSDFNLVGNKCLKDEVEDAFHERTCKSGYTLVNHDRCINKNKEVSKEAGYICDMPDSRLKGNKCILLERVDAKVK